MVLVRAEFQTKNPAAAAARPPTSQTNFFIRASLPIPIIGENGWEAGMDVRGEDTDSILSVPVWELRQGGPG